MSTMQMCRLCKNSKYLQDLFEYDGYSTLAQKVNFCINLKIDPEDNLPKMICKKCVKKIEKFYSFKRKCLDVDEQLRINSLCQSHDQNNFHTEDFNNIHLVPLDFKDSVSEDDIVDAVIKDNKPEHILETDHYLDHNIDVESVNENNVEEISNIYDNTPAIKECEPSIFQCELCGLILKTKHRFKQHVSSHNKPKYFQCKLCPKRFTRAETERIHMRSHYGIKPYVCEKCGAALTKQQDLARHMKIHTDERKHECPTCGRCFKRSGDLCSHRRTHTGIRPYKCLFCEKDYTSHGGLRKHYESHCKKDLSAMKNSNKSHALRER